MEYNKNDLINLGNKLKKSFFERKTRQKQRKYKPHDKYCGIDFWANVAKVCKDLKSHHEDFLDAAFKYNSVAGGPFPAQLTGDAIKKWVSENASHKDTSEDCSVMEEKVNIQLNAAARACFKRNETKGTSVEDTLMNPIVRIAPYARVILMKNSLESMVKYGEQVIEHIKLSPGLDEVLIKKGLKIELMYDVIKRRYKK